MARVAIWITVGLLGWFSTLAGAVDLGEDPDRDGLDAAAEALAGSDPAVRDTDGDGHPDGLEWLVLGTDPASADSDADGLGDREERLLRLDPANPDTDGDGLPDGEEVAAGRRADAADSDGDGLADPDEIARGTDPLAANTDGDSGTDGVEAMAGTDPLDPWSEPLASPDGDRDGLSDDDELVLGASSTLADTDGDGLGDGLEARVYHTDPAVADTDGDGVPDGIEVDELVSPLCGDSDRDGQPDGGEPGGLNPAARDSDGDGLIDGEETLIFLTDPTLADTDGGGAPDGAEVRVWGTSPFDASDDPPVVDSDGDLAGDDLEAALLTDPFDVDTDLDGLRDGAELTIHHSDPLLVDSDGDGLNDGEEHGATLSPIAPDTDGDGLADGFEATGVTDPDDADTDADGLGDGAEVWLWRTSPTNVDTDGGGAADGIEVGNGTDPLDPVDDVAAPADTDSPVDTDVPAPDPGDDTAPPNADPPAEDPGPGDAKGCQTAPGAPLAWLGWLALVLVACRPPKVDPEVTGRAPLTSPIPPDPAVLTGVLPNGLTWFVQHNEEPQDRLVLRLVIDAGSVLEDEDQRGIAHLVEHMAFNGTTRFPGNEVVTYLESIGAAFGPHVNAHTSFDETVYKLTVPTDDPVALGKALDVLEDWAGGIAFDPKDVEGERGVVLEEWRRNQGAGFRVMRATLPVSYGEAYANRLPIGTEESLKGFTPEVVSRFYRDWYRPELMAVIAVGDVDAASMAEELKVRFGDLVGPTVPRERVRVEMPPFAARRIVVVPDPELTTTSVSYGRGFDDREGNTHADARENAVERLMLAMLDERLDDLARATDRPFLSAGAGTRRMSPTEAGRFLSARAREGGASAALEAVLTEWVRVARHGFNPGELARAKAEQAAQWDELLAQKDDHQSVGEAEELVRVYTNGEYYAAIEYEAAMMMRFYEEVTLAEINGYASSWIAGDSVVTTVTLPLREGVAVPTEAEIAGLVDRVLASEPPALADISGEGPLVDSPPAPGTVTKVTALAPGLGFTRWDLSNGIEVYVRDTDFTADEIQFQLYSPGGSSLASDEDWVAATTATDLAVLSGFGSYDAGTLEKRLAGRRLSVRPWFGSQYEGLGGSSSKADLETALSLLWLEATAPRFDPALLARDRADRANTIRQRAANPETPFEDAYTAAMWANHRRHRPWTVEDLEQMDAARSERFYRDRFADFSDATVIIVGDVDEVTLRPWVEQWIGGLPGGGRVEQAADIGARRVPGQRAAEVRSGSEPQARVRVAWHGTFENDVLARNRMLALADVLRTLLREDLREARSGVYGVSVWTDEEKVPVHAWELGIEFVCDPARVPELREAALAIVESLRAKPVDGHYIADVQAKNRREREVSLRDNDFWVGSLTSFLQYGEDPASILTWDERNDALTPAVVQAAAASFLAPANRIQITRLPK